MTGVWEEGRWGRAQAAWPFARGTPYGGGDGADGCTKMMLRNRGEPLGFSILVAPFMAAAIRRANRKDLARLKTIIETSDVGMEE